MNAKMKRIFFTGLLIIASFFLFGCTVAYDLAHTGAGKSAQVEKINFFKNTDNLVSDKNSGGNLPDLFYISPKVDWTKYKKIIINDFTSNTSDVQKLSGLQIPEFKNMRKDIPDNIAQSIEGSVFSECIRSDKRIDHKDINSIKNMQADAILFGNISELKSGIRLKEHGGGPGLTAAQVEIKLVDRKTGEEIIKMISRSTSDGDKVSIPIIRRLANLMKKAAEAPQGTNQADASSVGSNQEVAKETTPKSSQQVTTNDNLPAKYLIVTKKTNIRAEDSTKSKIIAKAKVGEEIEKIDASDKWFKVRTKKGESGWIIKSAVKQAE